MGHNSASSDNFDFALGEYVNHCMADDVPALDAVATVRRFLPLLRCSTTAAKLCLRDRQRTREFQRATPFIAR